MKKFSLILACTLLLCCCVPLFGCNDVFGFRNMFGCSAGGVVPVAEATPTAKVIQGGTKEGFDISSIFDGLKTTGWVASRNASVNNPIIVEVDFGRNVSFKSITLEDGFDKGYTVKKPEDIKQTLSVIEGGVDACTTYGSDAAINVIDGNENSCWTAEDVPFAEQPQWIWLSFKTPVTTSKIELINESNISVLQNFEIYYTSTAHANPGYDDDGYYAVDTTDFTLLCSETANDEYNYSEKIEIPVVINDIIVKIYSQVDENGDPIEASLCELNLYSPADGYEFEHYPVTFTFQGKKDGASSFDVDNPIKVEAENTNSTWTFTSDKEIVYRYVQYIVYAEKKSIDATPKNNKPSIGNLKFA